MQTIARQLANDSPIIVRKAALAIDQAVVMATPVDTGRARSNWQVSLNAPAEGVIDAYAAGVGGNTGAQNAAQALQQGQDAISAFKLGDRSIHITNNLPYISALNDGHSAQAPAGFFERAVQVGIRAVKTSRVLRRR